MTTNRDSQDAPTAVHESHPLCRVDYETPFPETPVMRLPGVRFTVRGMMIAVAVIALVVGGGITWARQRAYKRMASAYAVRQTALEKGVGRWLARERRRKLEGLPLDCGLEGPYYRRSEKEVQWNALLRRKYERAAARPWLPVEPDPLEPK